MGEQDAGGVLEAAAGSQRRAGASTEHGAPHLEVMAVIDRMIAGENSMPRQQASCKRARRLGLTRGAAQLAHQAHAETRQPVAAVDEPLVGDAGEIGRGQHSEILRPAFHMAERNCL